MKREKFTRKEIIDIILSIVLIIATISIGFYQYRISTTQTKILNISSAPREATIEIIIPEKININARFLVRSGDERGSFSTLSFLNFGTMDSNILRCRADVSNNKFYAIILNETMGYETIMNIPEGSSVRRLLRITSTLCDIENYCDMPELVPVGEHRINFNCECFGCKKQRNFIQTINFCVYNNKTKECPD